jgi:hypothetical protein
LVHSKGAAFWFQRPIKASIASTSTEVYLVALGEQFIEFRLSEYAIQFYLDQDGNGYVSGKRYIKPYTGYDCLAQTQRNNPIRLRSSGGDVAQHIGAIY